MVLLILGVALWFGAHEFKRIAPDARAKMGEEKGKGPVALALLVSIVLMVIGYRMAQGAVFWGRSPMLTGLNNLLMLASFWLFAAAGMKTWITTKIRHPQLTGFILFCAAHLLVNGDVESLILFGGLLAWAVVAIVWINAQSPAWEPVSPAPEPKTEIRPLVGGLVVMVIVMLIHNWIGPRPWG